MNEKKLKRLLVDSLERGNSNKFIQLYNQVKRESSNVSVETPIHFTSAQEELEIRARICFLLAYENPDSIVEVSRKPLQIKVRNLIPQVNYKIALEGCFLLVDSRFVFRKKSSDFVFTALGGIKNERRAFIEGRRVIHS